MSTWKVLTLSLSLTMGTTTSWATDTWGLLASVEFTEHITETTWRVEKIFPQDLRGATEGFEITGFVVPIEAQGMIKSFLLVDDPLSCPFCGTGESYGPVLEVHLKRAVPSIAEFARVTVRGDLELIEDETTFQFFRLNQALVSPT